MSNYQHKRLLKCRFKSHKEQILQKSWQSYALNRTYQYKHFCDKQIKYVGRGACLKCLSPLGKSSSSLGMCKVTSGVTWCPVSHMCVCVSDLWRGMVSRKSVTCVCKLKNWMPMHSNGG